MTSAIAKRSVLIDGHKTSLSLELEFWNELREIAQSERITLGRLVQRIDAHRGETGNSNLSSAVRLFVLDAVRRRVPQQQAA